MQRRDIEEQRGAALREALDDLAELIRFPGSPKEFWPRYLKALARLLAARRVSLFIRAKAPNETEAAWKKVSEWGDPEHTVDPTQARRLDVAIEQLAESLGERCAAAVPIAQVLADEAGADVPGGLGDCSVITFKPKLYEAGTECLITAIVPALDPGAAREVLLRAELASDTPATYQMNQAARTAGFDAARLATALDVSILINDEEKFVACSLAFCNGIAAQFECDRVSLGWMEKGFMRLRAISRTEKFDRQMEAAQLLEAAMDEAFDQDDEITWPAQPDAATVAKDHERFAKNQGAVSLISLPLRVDDEPVGAITCERSSSPFGEQEAAQLRLACDVAARRIADLQSRDRWIGARAASKSKQLCAKLVGAEHTWAKLIALFLVGLVAVLIFWQVDYRVEANFILKSDEVNFVSAPFDGYIDSVSVRSGDQLAAGATILTLKDEDLELERASAEADVARYRSEVQKSRGAGELSALRIAESLAAQAQARLDLAQHRLGQTVVKAPFASIVVEGDQRERVGAPVKQGEVLFKLAQTSSLYIEAEVDERDIHEILDRDGGELAFVSQPKLKYPIRITQIVPAATPGKDGNVFLVHAGFVGEQPDWWKPGMSGVCKLSVEKRSLGWVLTHRTSDFLRLYFWW
ncbi:MAG: multidrug resistance efflux pump [Pseudoalteromonas tetraodonis]